MGMAWLWTGSQIIPVHRINDARQRSGNSPDSFSGDSRFDSDLRNQICYVKGLDMNAFYENVKSVIDEYGRQVICVPFSDGGYFAYTIGNRENNVPDLVIVKFGSPEQQCMILNGISETIANEGIVLDPAGTVVDYGFSYPAKLIKASEDAKSILSVQTGQYYRTEDYELYQVLLPDVLGKFPGDVGFDMKFNVPLV